MKKLYCMKCGRKINIRFGMIPKKCFCGAEFNKTDDIKNAKKIIGSIVLFALLMLPLFIFIYLGRVYFQNSIILFGLALLMIVFWYRIVETFLIRIGVVIMKNIEIKE